MNVDIGRNDNEIGLMSLRDNLIVLHNGKRYTIDEYIDKLQNNWNELKKWLEEEIDYCSGTDDMDFINMKNAYESTMLEMQELEQGKDE